VIAGLEQVRREVGLDGDALIAAVHAEAGPVSGWRDTRRERTNDVVAGSLPQHQGALRPGDPIPADAQQPAELRIGRYVALAAALLALAGGVYAMLGHRSHTPEPSKPPVSAPIPAPTTRDTVAAGDIAGARALAADDLRARLGGESLQQRGFVVEALESARVPAAAKLLQEALHGPPGVQDRAARALGELGLPDAAIKLGAALSGAPEQVKVELAAAMYRLGNKDARAILAKALDGGGTALGKMIAAEAMALAGDPAGRAVLAQALIDVRAGNELWYRAARGLLELGDGNARKQLEAERSQRDPARIVAAAELLARAGDASSQEVLARVAADDDHAAQSAAALALARLGDKRALDWVARGLASTDPELRRRAVAICGPLAASAAAHRASIAKLATEDPDLRVRLTAEVVLLSL
jgi:HEAT repeat protein